MNKSIKISLLIVVLSMFGAKTSAHEFAVENADGVLIYYNYCNNGTELEVTSLNESGRCYSGNVVIPEEVTYMNRTRKVTSIGESSFHYCIDLNSVTIPSSVKAIQRDAFWNCGGLTSVHISNISAWCNISFSNDQSNPVSWAHHLFLNGEEIKELVIPNNVTSISERAFLGCYYFTSVKIPNSVTTIGNYAFAYCSDLTSVTIPNGVISIGEAAFSGCSSLSSVIIPKSVTSIGINAFSYSDIPTVVSLIENPYKIDGSTFSNNTFLNATLYVPDGTIDKYKETEGWNDFVYIEEGAGPNGGGQKCAKPTISVVDGKLEFSCETEEVEYHYAISNNSPASGVGNDVPFSQKYTITVYASKSGYDNSDTATAEITATVGLTGDANGDGVVNAADVVKVTNIIMGE